MLKKLFQATIPQAAPASNPIYTGKSGLTYTFEKLIQKRVTGRIWIARAGGRRYILKELPESYHLNYTKEILPRLESRLHRNIRLPYDVIPDHRIFIYEYLSHDFLELARTDLGSIQRKQILKSVLCGLAEMHDQGIVHLDVKPDNIVVDVDNEADMRVVKATMFTDLENAVYLPPGHSITGMLAGNDNWRSPEAHLREKLNAPADMFSFGAVCIYAVLGRVIFGRDDDFEHHVSQGVEPGLIRLQRQTSYFGDEDGYKGLRKYLSHDERLCQLLDAMWEDRRAPYIPYRHFSTWSDVEDSGFRDVVLKMMNLDPARRITAKDALEHPWFTDHDIA